VGSRWWWGRAGERHHDPGDPQLAVREKTLTSSYFGSAPAARGFPKMLSLYTAGKLKLDELVTRRYKLDEAHRRRRSGSRKERAGCDPSCDTRLAGMQRRATRRQRSRSAASSGPWRLDTVHNVDMRARA